MASREPFRPFHWRCDELDDNSFKLHGYRSLLFLLVASAFLLALTFLCIYLRWYLHHRRSIADPVQHHLSLPPAAGLDEKSISRLPVSVHFDAGGVEVQCSICLGDLVQGDRIKALPGCGHEFHVECIDPWLRTCRSCPLCRAQLGGESAASVALDIPLSAST